MDDENRQLDEEIVDADRAADLARIAQLEIDRLDDERWTTQTAAEDDLEKQLVDLEREIGSGTEP